MEINDETLDEVGSVTNFLESAKDAKIEKDDSDQEDYSMRTGYLDVIKISHRDRASSQDDGKYARFKQDEDYYNPNTGQTDRQKPMEEIEIIRKKGLSNGVIIFDRKRTVNFETGKYSHYFSELRKD